MIQIFNFSLGSKVNTNLKFYVNSLPRTGVSIIASVDFYINMQKKKQVTEISPNKKLNTKSEEFAY